MKVRNLVRCGICASLMVVCGWLALPLGEISVTMQSFGVFLTLYLLGGSQGTAAFVTYLTLGVLGLPVFSGFRGGIGVLLGPTGGYLWGFLLVCLLFWLLEKRISKVLLLILGQLVCYLCGTAWYGLVYAPGGLWGAVLLCILPYLLPDAIKIFLAVDLGKRIKNMRPS